MLDLSYFHDTNYGFLISIGVIYEEIYYWK